MLETYRKGVRDAFDLLKERVMVLIRAEQERLGPFESFADVVQPKADKALEAAIKVHHDQKADDRCWMDDLVLYQAAGLPVHDCRVGDKAAMLANCARFIDKRCAGGGWPSYAELEAERNRLRNALEGVVRTADRATVEFDAARAVLGPVRTELAGCRDCDPSFGCFSDITLPCRKNAHDKSMGQQ